MKFVLQLLLVIETFVFLLSCSKNKTEKFERFYFHNEGADMAVQVDGNKTSNIFILVLHGGPGGGGAAYNSGEYADELEKKYAMVYLDQRGNGASQGNYDKSRLTIAQNSKDIHALSIFLKKKYGSKISLFVMGHSWGGLTGTHALLNTPLQSEIKGWIEVDGAHDLHKNSIESVKMFLQFSEQQIKTGNNVDFWKPIFDKVSTIDTNNISDADEGFMNENGFKAEEKIAEITTTSGNGSPPFGIVNSPDISLTIYLSNNLGNPILNADSQKYPLTTRLHEINVPCLFLWGKYDFVVPLALGQSAYKLVGTTKKKLVVFEHSGHSPMSNEASLFVSEVSAFVELHK